MNALLLATQALCSIQLYISLSIDPAQLQMMVKVSLDTREMTRDMMKSVFYSDPHDSDHPSSQKEAECVIGKSYRYV